MGCYDTLTAKINCPHCGQETNLKEQVKWAERLCSVYTLGDEVFGANDGDYFYGSSVRDTLWNTCNKCNKEIIYGVRIEDGKFTEVLFEEDKSCSNCHCYHDEDGSNFEDDSEYKGTYEEGRADAITEIIMHLEDLR